MTPIQRRNGASSTRAGSWNHSSAAVRQVRHLPCDSPLMEAATPLRTPHVRTVGGDRVAVDGLVVDDDTAVRLVREREDAGEDTVAAAARRPRDRRPGPRPRADRSQRRLRQVRVREGGPRAAVGLRRAGPRGCRSSWRLSSPRCSGRRTASSPRSWSVSSRTGAPRPSSTASRRSRSERRRYDLCTALGGRPPQPARRLPEDRPGLPQAVRRPTGREPARDAGDDRRTPRAAPGRARRQDQAASSSPRSASAAPPRAVRSRRRSSRPSTGSPLPRATTRTPSATSRRPRARSAMWSWPSTRCRPGPRAASSSRPRTRSFAAQGAARARRGAGRARRRVRSPGRARRGEGPGPSGTAARVQRRQADRRPSTPRTARALALEVAYSLARARVLMTRGDGGGVDAGRCCATRSTAP